MIGFLISLIPAFVLLVLKLKKSFHMLQQNWYNDDSRYTRWLKDNIKKVFLNYELLFIIVYIFSYFFNNIFLMYLDSMLYIIVSIFYLIEQKKEVVKKPLIYTKRIKRLYFTTLLIYLLPVLFMCLNYNPNNINNYYLIINIMIYLTFIIIIITNIINKPVEKLVYFYYRNKAINNLNSVNPVVIGITGSYGKTSSKNVLYDILSCKYDTLKTPLNYNTPNGLIRTLNENLDKFNQYFIAEMGACHVGEINDCCKLVKPKFGIITCIGKAHLETFKSQDNIIKTKFELIESLPSDGVGILNYDDELQKNYKINNKCKILTIGIKNHDVDLYADNIKITNEGTKFDCVFKNDKKKYTFETKLLGETNVYNLLTSILLGKYLNIEIGKLQSQVKTIKPIEHRLELKKYGRINIIDDAYNSNPVGSKTAVEVLGLMDGYKVIVTPGMIELGKEQYDLNFKFGEYINSNVDEVILVGSKQTKPILDALNNKKFDKDKIHVINDVKLAFPMINKINKDNIYVLLENDLPDIFNE